MAMQTHRTVSGRANSNRWADVVILVVACVLACAVGFGGATVHAADLWAWIDDAEEMDEEVTYYYADDESVVDWVWNGETWVWLTYEQDMAEDEFYDFNHEYVDGDGSPIEWEWIDEDEPPDSHYEYVYSDGTPVEWEWVDGQWRWVTCEQELADDEPYELTHDYYRADGTLIAWEWVEDGELYDANYDYAYPDLAPVGEEHWEEVE